MRELVFPIEGQATYGSSPAESHEATVRKAPRSIGHIHNLRPGSRVEGVGQNVRGRERRDVVVISALADIELEVRTDTQQVIPAQCHPVPQ